MRRRKGPGGLSRHHLSSALAPRLVWLPSGRVEAPPGFLPLMRSRRRPSKRQLIIRQPAATITSSFLIGFSSLLPAAKLAPHDEARDEEAREHPAIVNRRLPRSAFHTLLPRHPRARRGCAVRSEERRVGREEIIRGVTEH